MKILATIIFSLTTLLTFAQQNQTKINNIRKTVEQINKGKGYTVKTLEAEEFLEYMTDNGGRLTAYFNNGRLVKIDELVGLSSCENHTMYYLKDNKLIFVYIRGTQAEYVDSIKGFNSEGYKLKMECRFYFDNGKMIKSILKGATICNGAPLDSDAKIYQDECLRYMKLLKAK